VIGRLLAEWPASEKVQAFTTTRAGGVSELGWASLNLGDRTGDLPEHVAENRRRFAALLPGPPGWLRQVHGNQVQQRETLGDRAPEADAVFSTTRGLPCTILTADCLPVLFCDRSATTVAAAHAGWRGLAGGVLESTIDALPAAPDELLAWIGPGIGATVYEVGPDFREHLRERLPWLEDGFLEVNGAVHADLEAIARAILRRAGVTEIHGGGFCTYTDSERFFSHRREPSGGRMATTIWLEDQDAL
jgi:YfiH family protein